MNNNDLEVFTFENINNGASIQTYYDWLENERKSDKETINKLNRKIMAFRNREKHKLYQRTKKQKEYRREYYLKHKKVNI